MVKKVFDHTSRASTLFQTRSVLPGHKIHALVQDGEVILHHPGQWVRNARSYTGQLTKATGTVIRCRLHGLSRPEKSGRLESREEAWTPRGRVRAPR